MAAQISEVSDVGDDEGHAKLIFCADLSQRDAPVFDGEAAAVAVVADLNQLILQRAVG